MLRAGIFFSFRGPRVAAQRSVRCFNEAEAASATETSSTPSSLTSVSVPKSSEMSPTRSDARALLFHGTRSEKRLHREALFAIFFQATSVFSTRSAMRMRAAISVASVTRAAPRQSPGGVKWPSHGGQQADTPLSGSICLCGCSFPEMFSQASFIITRRSLKIRFPSNLQILLYGFSAPLKAVFQLGMQSCIITLTIYFP